MKSLIVIAFSLFMISCGEQRQAETEKTIGIQLWSVKDNMNENAAATLAALGEMGYSFVEAAGYRDGQFYGMDPVEFKELVEANNMSFVGSHTGQDLPTEENWETTMQWWDRAIAAHKEAGVEYIVQPWMGKAGFESLDGLKRFCDYFNAVGEKCNEQGIRFGFHNHANEFQELEGQIIYDFMLQNTDPDKVMFQMDIYWVIEGGHDPVDYFNRYPGRFESLHVKDETEVGASGNIDFERIFNNAGDSGKEYIVVEVENYNYEPLESVRVSLDYLKNADYIK
jgi:sugar phosphate isomerase/epimerase